VAILCVAAFFIFYKISHGDMVGDDAHYSVRAIGLADFMFGDSQFQSTPLQWFTVLPWWTRLSFHDHPLVLFYIQHLFLRVSTSVFFAKLPYALMALSTIALTYAWCKKIFNREIGLIAALLLTLNAHFIWFGRSAFMESGVLFMITLTWYYFIRFLQNEKYFWHWGILLGLLLETKFTTLYVVVAMLLYVAVRERRLFKVKKFYYALGIAAVIFLPQVLYNVLMQQATGHFALQLARLFNQPSSPWHLTGASTSPLQGAFQSVFNLGQLFSWPTLLVSIGAVAYVFAKRTERWLLGLPLIFLLLEDATIGSKDLWSIFLAPVIAVAAYDIYQKIKSTPWQKYTAITTAVLYCTYLTFFLANSHVFVKHIGSIGWLHSSVTSDNFGVLQLDAYLNKLVSGHPELTRLDPYGDIKIKQSNLHTYLLQTTAEDLEKSVTHANIIIFDNHIDWFSRVWLFERRRFYNNLPVFSISENNLLQQLTYDSFYFIKAESGAPLETVTAANDLLAGAMEEKVTKLGIVPDLIYRDDGKLAFKIYHVTSSTK
jgi:hypothetical protein